MRGLKFIAVTVIAAACTNCATPPKAAAPERAPFACAELLRMADAMLAYTDGAATTLPEGVFAVAPLEEDGKDRAKELQKTADEMRDHAAAVAALKAKGIVGEDNRGYLDMRDDKPFATAAEKNAAQKAMSAENDARKTLYRGIAHASEDRGLTLTRVERAFAVARLARSARGARVQAPSNDEEYEAFLETPLGRSVGAQTKPGDWVEVP